MSSKEQKVSKLRRIRRKLLRLDDPLYERVSLQIENDIYKWRTNKKSWWRSGMRIVE